MARTYSALAGLYSTYGGIPGALTYASLATVPALSGSVVGSSSSSGSVSGSATRTGSASGSATSSGSVSGRVGFAGTAAGSSTVSGSASGAPSLSGSTVGESTAAGSVVGVENDLGAVSGVSTSSGYASGAPGLRGVTGGESGSTGSASGTPTLAGSVTGSSTSTGTALGQASTGEPEQTFIHSSGYNEAVRHTPSTRYGSALGISLSVGSVSGTPRATGAATASRLVLVSDVIGTVGRSGGVKAQVGTTGTAFGIGARNKRRVDEEMLLLLDAVA